MVDRNVVAAKLAELQDRVSRASQRCPPTAAELAADRDALDLVSFNLMLAVQCCADIASHVIADERWPTPTTQAAAFNRLRDQGVLSASTAEALCRAVGLRNVVVHGYAAVRPDLVFAAATAGIRDLESFATEVARAYLP